MASQFTYSTTNDTLNAKVDIGKLNQEILDSNIIIAIDSMNTSGDNININFKANISSSEETTLNGLVAVHDGGSILEAEIVKIEGQEYSDEGNIVQRSIPQKTQEKTYSRATHDFCNKCTWYYKSVRVTDEILGLKSGNTYEADNDYFIDVINGIINRQDIHQAYAIEVKIDDIVQTSGYIINHKDGEITFTSAPGGAVKCSYSYATTSEWSLQAPQGTNLIIEHSEVQFTDDVLMSDVMKFEIWITHPVYGRIPGETIKYNSIRDIINESNLGFTVPSMPGVGRPLVIFPFNYVGEKIMDSGLDAELIISCENHEEITGTYGTATFYLIERSA